MKRDIADFMFKYFTCQQVKLEHQRPSGLLQQLLILEWKWDMIAMDFVSGLPHASSGYDAIWVIVDRLTKIAHFLPLIEFAYNNSYHASIEMAPYEALCGRKCRSPLCCEIRKRQLTSPKLVQITSEKVFIIQQRLKIAFSR